MRRSSSGSLEIVTVSIVVTTTARASNLMSSSASSTTSEAWGSKQRDYRAGWYASAPTRPTMSEHARPRDTNQGTDRRGPEPLLSASALNGSFGGSVCSGHVGDGGAYRFGGISRSDQGHAMVRVWNLNPSRSREDGLDILGVACESRA
jgi:hypothetical protein